MTNRPTRISRTGYPRTRSFTSSISAEPEGPVQVNAPAALVDLGCLKREPVAAGQLDPFASSLLGNRWAVHPARETGRPAPRTKGGFVMGLSASLILIAVGAIL